MDMVPIVQTDSQLVAPMAGVLVAVQEMDAALNGIHLVAATAWVPMIIGGIKKIGFI